jgi:hypothetical protein
MNRLFRILRTQVRRKGFSAEVQGSKQTLFSVPQLTALVHERLSQGHKVQISEAMMNASGENIIHLSIECDAGLKAAFSKENNDFSKIDESHFVHALDVGAEEIDLDDIDEVKSIVFEEADFKFIDRKLTKMLGYFVDKMDRISGSLALEVKVL